jgi:hypothetical protein
MSSNPAERFGRIVHERRVHLDFTQADVTKHGGPSNTKQTEIENGLLASLLPNMAKKLDRGLQWEPGSARRTWLGGGPTPLEAGGTDVARRLAEIEDSNLSESTKRWLIEDLIVKRATQREAGETA